MCLDAKLAVPVRQDIARWLYVADARTTSIRTPLLDFPPYLLPTMDPTDKPSNQDKEKANAVKGARCMPNIIMQVF
jgi:hypothetical protein